MSAWVELTSGTARRAFVAGPFDTLADAQAWAAHWRGPRRTVAPPEVASLQVDAERDGALPPTDWMARTSEDPARW